MRYEKILKRPDGKQNKICVCVSVGSGKTQYKTSVEQAEKGKRTWQNVTDDNKRLFRKLSPEEQAKTDFENQLTLVTEQELYDAKIEAWQKIKPTF